MSSELGFTIFKNINIKSDAHFAKMAKLLLTSCLALLVAQHDAATAPNVLMVKKKRNKHCV